MSFADDRARAGPSPPAAASGAGPADVSPAAGDACARSTSGRDASGRAA
jgi:hypothetical protein